MATMPSAIEKPPNGFEEESTSEPPMRNIAAAENIPRAKLTTICTTPSGSGKRPTPTSAAAPSNVHTAPNRYAGEWVSLNSPNEKMMPRMPATANPESKRSAVVDEVTKGRETFKKAA